MFRNFINKNKPGVAQDQELTLRETEQYIVKRGFSAYHVAKIAEAVGNTVVANWGVKDRQLIRVKKSDIDTLLASATTIRTH